MDTFDAILGGTDELYIDLVKNALEKRVLIFNEEVTDAVVENYVMRIIFWNQEDKDLPIEKRQPIKIFINSPGGDAVVCFNMVNAIEASKTPVIGICLGLTASAAYYVLLACHERIAFKDSVILQHDGSINISHSTSKAKDVMNFFDNMEERTKQHVLTHTKMDSDFYDLHFDQEFYMYPDQAKELGVIDKIIGEDVDLDYIL